MLGKDEIRQILQARFSGDLHKKMSEIPHPCDLKECYKAAERIKRAIERDERIVVVGDYDVDGVVSSAIVADFLSLMGAEFSVRIPNRFTDGYGLSEEIIGELRGTDLILTVDNGITANEAAKLAKKHKIDLVITDHHMPGAVLPDAFAIVNPKQPGCTFPNVEICGAQVAWYLVGALKDVCGVNLDMTKYLDLLSVAIVADMMELRGMNRVLVRSGLRQMNKLRRPCFEAIRCFLGKRNFDFEDISFLIAPLINSAGRMDDATISYKFLRARNFTEANFLFEKIKEFNDSRKAEERALFDELLARVDERDRVLVLWGEGWHEGVLGIVASRVSKQFNKPCIVFSIDGERAKGSARSVEKFDILELIGEGSELLLGFGGHKGAAGVSMLTSNLEAFRQKMNSAKALCELSEARFYEGLLGEIDMHALDGELLALLDEFEPYGQKNPRPLFQICDAFVVGVKPLGREGKHIKIALKKGDAFAEVIFFNFDYMPQMGELLSLVVSVSRNVWAGQESVQVLVKEILCSE